MSGTARTRSYATATACSAPTSSTTAVTSRWGILGTTSTSLPSGVRRSGRTRRRATLRRRRTSGGGGTTSTATTKPPPRSSNRSAGAAQPHRPATPRDRAVPADVKQQILIYKREPMAEAEKLSLEIKRFIKASPDRVYAAWTDPVQLKKWFGPENVQTRNLIADARVGGQFRWDCTDPEGKQVTISGEYRQLQPGKKIVLSWQLEEDEDWKNHSSIVTIELFDREGGTELRLTHEKLPNEASRDDHKQGWNRVLEKFETAAKIIRSRRLHGKGWKDHPRRVPATRRLRFTHCESRIAFAGRHKSPPYIPISQLMWDHCGAGSLVTDAASLRAGCVI